MDIKLEKKRGLQWKHLPYVAGVVVVLVLILLIVFGGSSRSLRIERKTLSVSTVKRGEFSEYIRITGQVLPKVTVLLTALEGGVVKEFAVEEGAMVKKGDVIARLENSQLNLDIMNTEASLAEKENFLRDTRVKMEQEKLSLQQEMVQLKTQEQRAARKAEQYRRLVAEKLVSVEDYAQAQEDYELAASRRRLVGARQVQDSIYRSVQIDNMEISLGNMKRNMALTYERLDNLNIKSPIDGQLGALDIVLGQNIQPGTKVGQVSDLTAYKIQARVDEHYIDRITRGLSSSFERGKQTFALQVSKVYPEVVEAKFKIDLTFTGTMPDNIRSGQTHYINVETGEPDSCLFIDRGAFYQNTGGGWIYVLDEDGGRASRRAIRIDRQNPLYYEVVQGLSEGERVVVSSYDLLGQSKELVFK